MALPWWRRWHWLLALVLPLSLSALVLAAGITVRILYPQPVRHALSTLALSLAITQTAVMYPRLHDATLIITIACDEVHPKSAMRLVPETGLGACAGRLTLPDLLQSRVLLGPCACR